MEKTNFTVKYAEILTTANTKKEFWEDVYGKRRLHNSKNIFESCDKEEAIKYYNNERENLRYWKSNDNNTLYAIVMLVEGSEENIQLKSCSNNDWND